MFDNLLGSVARFIFNLSVVVIAVAAAIFWNIPTSVVSFQKQAADLFRQSINQRRSISVSVIGVGHYESYVTVYGEEEGQELTDALLGYVQELSPQAVIIGFSIGAIMAVLPDVDYR